MRESAAEGVGSCLPRENIVKASLRKLEKGFCSALRRGETEHAERREEFEFERVVSCGRGEQRWRAKLDLGSGKSLDDLHRSTALGAMPEIIRGRTVLISLRLLYCAEQWKAQR